MTNSKSEIRRVGEMKTCHLCDFDSRCTLHNGVEDTSPVGELIRDLTEAHSNSGFLVKSDVRERLNNLERRAYKRGYKKGYKDGTAQVG
jgi:hypothetical protein